MNKLLKMKIQKRLVTSYIVVALVVSVASIVAGVSLLVISRQYSDALTNYGFAQGDIGRMMTAFADLRSNTRAIIGYDEEDLRESCLNDWKAKKTELETYMKEVEITNVSEAAEQKYTEIKAAMDEYFAVEAKVQELGNTDDPELSKQAQQLAYTDMASTYSKAYQAMEELLEIKVTNGDRLSHGLENLEFILIIVIVLMIIIAFFIAFKLGAAIAKTISDPLSALSDRLHNFAKGDLTGDFPHIESEDEVAAMVRTAKEMGTNLSIIIKDLDAMLAAMADGDWTSKFMDVSRYVGDFAQLKEAIEVIQERMNETLHNVEDVSNQVSIGAGSLAEAAQSLAEGATDQAGSVEEMQATITNITDGVSHTAEKAKASSEQASQYSAEAEDSRKEMEHLMEIMVRIAETSEKIGNIISEIEDIASQTNLLSLNASIEAARAGEAGRGFAVVADQIGKLADQSAKSAVDTRGLIEGALQEIKESNTAAEHATDTIQKVAKGVRSIAETAAELMEISEEQATAMAQAEQGINQISEIVQSNSAAAEELSATSEEMLAQSENMSNLLKQFKLK